MILCLSGGIDSVIAYYKLNKPQTIFFDTGGYADAEKDIVLKIAPNTIIDTSLRFDQIKIGESAFIPNRNLLFAARAMQYDSDIVIAGLKDDMVSDKDPKAFKAMEEVLNAINPNRTITVTSPFWNFTKANIVEWFLNEFVDAENILDQCLSCYTPIDGKECLSCPSCFRKWNALMVNGIYRPFHNNELLSKYYKSAKNGKYVDERNKSIIWAIDKYSEMSVETCLNKNDVPKTFCFDIDGVITNETEGHDYKNRTPNKEIIEQINGLYSVGHKIILHTARWGTDWKVTKHWLDRYNVHYHELILAKPKADYYIDDKMISMEELLHG